MASLPKRTLLEHGRVDPAKVRACREAAGYGTIYAAELALAGVINHVTLRRWESTKHPLQRVFLDTLQAFAEAYHCGVLDLLTIPEDLLSTPD